jgi:translocation and assembly module TamB
MLGLLGSQKKEAVVAGPEKERIFVDIALLGKDNLRVENNIGEFAFQVDLRVRGYLPSPEIIGEVSAKDGFVRFRAHEYQLMRSSVEFLGDLGSGTLIDAAATTTVGQYTVNVSATGSLDDARVELSSVPPLQRQDIIALLALGTTSENVSTGDVTAFEATSFLTGGIQDELESQANELLGVDQFHIDPAYSQALQTTVPRVTVGKALGESLYARYGVLMGAQPEQGVSLEYTVKSGVLLLGSWSDQGKESQGSFGGEIRFRVTFR